MGSSKHKNGKSKKKFPFKFYERVGSVVTGLKLLNPPPEPNVRFLSAHDPNSTDHTIWIHSLGFGSGGSSWFNRVN